MSTAPGPQVAPSRIRQARLRAGLSLEDVSAKLAEAGHPLTRAALSKYELGKSVPRQSTLVLLSRILGVPAAYFLGERSVHIEWLASRKHARLSRSRQDQLQAWAEGIVEAQVLLEEMLEPLRRPSFPRFQKVHRPEDAESAAESVRRHWKLGEAAIESVVQTLEDNGGIVVYPRDASPDFDGLYGWANRVHPILVSRREGIADRRRYDHAHGLAHLVMDCGNASEEEQEALAHRFAAAFLVPAAVARRELGARRRALSADELRLLEERFGLSTQEWARRAFDLQIIDGRAHQKVRVALKTPSWLVKEPVAFVGNEEPMRLRLLTLRALADGLITPAKADELCPGCTPAGTAPARMRPSDLRKLPREQQEEALRRGAAAMASEYEQESPLRGFEAYGEIGPDEE